MKRNYDLTLVLSDMHNGKWVAFNPEHTSVLDFDDDLQALTQRVDTSKVVFSRVLDPGKRYVFSNYRRAQSL